MEIGPREVDTDGQVKAGTILAAAVDAVQSSIAGPHGGHLCDVRILFLNSARAASLGVCAELLISDPELNVWRVGVSDDKGEEIAQVLCTLKAAGSAAAVNAGGAASAVRAARTKAKPAPETETSLGSTRRERIALAASDVIAAKGFAAASIREIADAAGLHVPTLYQYVSSKDEVLELVYDQVMEQIGAELDASTVSHASARDTIKSMLVANLSVSDRRKRNVGVLNRELRSLQPEARRRVLAKYNVLIDRYAEIVAAGVRSGEFRDVNPGIVANFIDGFGDIWALRQFSLGRYALSTYIDETTSFLFAGIAARR